MEHPHDAVKSAVIIASFPVGSEYLYSFCVAVKTCASSLMHGVNSLPTVERCCILSKTATLQSLVPCLERPIKVCRFNPVVLVC